MLEKRGGVSIAMPFCDSGMVEVWMTKRGALDEKTAREVVEKNPKFKLKRFAVQQPPKKAGKKKKGKTRRVL